MFDACDTKFPQQNYSKKCFDKILKCEINVSMFKKKSENFVFCILTFANYFYTKFKVQNFSHYMKIYTGGVFFVCFFSYFAEYKNY